MWGQWYIPGAKVRPGWFVVLRRGAKEVNAYMDGKGGSGRSSGKGRPRKRKSVLKTLRDRKQLVTFWKAHRSSLVAGFLITAIVVLLFGIFCQLQAPSNENVPGDET